MTRHTPIFPGAMTPAQIARKIAERILYAVVVVLGIVTFAALFIIFN